MRNIPATVFVIGLVGSSSPLSGMEMSKVAAKSDMLKAIIYSPQDPEILYAGPFYWRAAREKIARFYPANPAPVLLVEGTVRYDEAIKLLRPSRE